MEQSPFACFEGLNVGSSGTRGVGPEAVCLGARASALRSEGGKSTVGMEGGRKRRGEEALGEALR